MEQDDDLIEWISELIDETNCLEQCDNVYVQEDLQQEDIPDDDDLPY